MDLARLLAGDTATVDVEWEGDTTKVMYLKHAYTPKLEAEVFAAAQSDSGGGQALADLLGHLIHDWDVMNGTEPFPPTRENIAILPVSFLVKVMQAIAEAMSSDPLLSGNSDGRS